MKLISTFLDYTYRVFGVLAEPHNPRPAKTLHLASHKRRCPLRSLPVLKTKKVQHT